MRRKAAKPSKRAKRSVSRRSQAEGESSKRKVDVKASSRIAATAERKALAPWSERGRRQGRRER